MPLKFARVNGTSTTPVTNTGERGNVLYFSEFGGHRATFFGSEGKVQNDQKVRGQSV